MLDWIYHPAKTPSETHHQEAIRRQQQLTKPAGSLGRLETLAEHIASLQHSDTPEVENIEITVFAGDHGIAAEGVSAFPQAVTAQMIQNFSAGGAAITVLAKHHRAAFSVINTGTVTELNDLPHVIDRSIAKGTANFSQNPAMNQQQLASAFAIGAEVIQKAAANHCQLWIGGEMGIANTTAATAIACSLLNKPVTTIAGPGTGVTGDALQHKIQVIENALAKHAVSEGDALAALQCFGGFEIAALVGAYIAAAQQGIIVLVDGFICTVAARCAMVINPSIRPWLLLSHTSAEPGHQSLTDAFMFPPLLDLSLRLGEASGAAITLPLIQQACALHNGMATFADAGVDDKDD